MGKDPAEHTYTCIYLSQVASGDGNFILYHLSTAFPNWGIEACITSNKNKLCSKALVLLLRVCNPSACWILVEVGPDLSKHQFAQPLRAGAESE